MNTCDTVVRVRGVLRCAKMQHRTRTRVTRFGRTAGLPVPVRNPSGGRHRDVAVAMVVRWNL